jgi:transposase-like protein
MCAATVQYPRLDKQGGAMSKEGSEIERLADFVGVLKSKPRTIAEVSERLGVGTSTVRRWIGVFQDKGHVEPLGAVKFGNVWRGVWGWVR